MEFVILSTNTTSLDLSNMGLTELPDLSKFQYIYHFNCSNNKLTSLHNLPPSITYLYCNNNQLTSLPELPETITNFQCCNGPQLLTNC